MIAATFGFGIIPIFLKHFAQTLDAWTVNGVRYSVGALFWLPFLLVLDRQSNGKRPLGADRNVWRDAVVPSVVNIVGQAAFGVSPYFVPASTIGFVLRLSFLFTIVFGFAAEPPGRSRKLVTRRSAGRGQGWWRQPGARRRSGSPLDCTVCLTP